MMTGCFWDRSPLLGQAIGQRPVKLESVNQCTVAGEGDLPLLKELDECS